jgi:hypothetical protein
MAARLLVHLNMTAADTVRRMVRIAQGREFAGTTVDIEGNTVHVPFSDKVQWDAMKWQAERVLPPVATTDPNAAGNTVIYNQTTYVATMNKMSGDLTKLTALFGGPSAPAGGSPGEVATSLGESGPPSMFTFVKQGRAQLVQTDEQPTVIDVTPR